MLHTLMFTDEEIRDLRIVLQGPTLDSTLKTIQSVREKLERVEHRSDGRPFTSKERT